MAKSTLARSPSPGCNRFDCIPILKRLFLSERRLLSNSHREQSAKRPDPLPQPASAVLDGACAPPKRPPHAAIAPISGEAISLAVIAALVRSGHLIFRRAGQGPLGSSEIGRQHRARGRRVVTGRRTSPRFQNLRSWTQHVHRGEARCVAARLCGAALFTAYEPEAARRATGSTSRPGRPPMQPMTTHWS